MPSKHTARTELLRGTLDLIVLQTLATMGSLHSYQIGDRLAQVAEDDFALNQGTLYPALIRLEQRGWIKGEWAKTAAKRDAKYYTITRAGRRALGEKAARWNRLVRFVNRLRTNPA